MVEQKGQETQELMCYFQEGVKMLGCQQTEGKMVGWGWVMGSKEEEEEKEEWEEEEEEEEKEVGEEEDSSK